MKDENSLIEIKWESFIPNKNYKYISLFPIDEEAILSLTGMKYNLENYTLKRNEPTLGISNECMDNPYVEIKSGSLLVISSMEDHENL
jgi:thiamine pyrophosphokinase